MIELENICPEEPGLGLSICKDDCGCKVLIVEEIDNGDICKVTIGDFYLQRIIDALLS